MTRNETLGLVACGVMVAINLGIFAVTVVIALLHEPSRHAPVAVWEPDTPDSPSLDAAFEARPLMAIPDDPSDLLISQGVAEENP